MFNSKMRLKSRNDEKFKIRMKLLPTFFSFLNEKKMKQNPARLQKNMSSGRLPGIYKLGFPLSVDRTTEVNQLEERAFLTTVHCLLLAHQVQQLCRECKDILKQLFELQLSTKASAFFHLFALESHN